MAKAAQSKSSRKSEKAGSVGEVRYGENVGTAFIDGFTFRSKPVQYVEIDGMAMVEGDINLGPIERVQQQTKMRQAELAGGPVAAAAMVSGSQFRWPNCTVPYQIDSQLPKQERVTDAIAHWETNTTFSFVHRTPANEAQYPDYVEFVPGNGCSSFIGKQGGKQAITLGPDCSVGNTIHEIGHAVGLWHEQSREDRDAFVTIQWPNIIPEALNNFAQHITDGEDVGPYDYGSIMHYPRNAFSSNGQDTIIPVDADAEIGQRNGLSLGDIAAVNSLCGRVFGEPLTVPISHSTRKLATGREPLKRAAKELRKEWPKERAKEQQRDAPKLWPPKERPADTPKVWTKELGGDPPEKGFEPGPWPGPGPLGSQAAPFVLATGGPPPGGEAPAPPAAPGDVEQQLAAYREVLGRFAQLHAQGLLGPADMAQWQEHATAAQQLAGG